MSLDKSLKSHDALVRHRNVLRRDERIEILMDEEQWRPGDSVFGLPKVSHRKVMARRSRPKKEAPAAEAEAAPQPGSGAAEAPAADADGAE